MNVAQEPIEDKSPIVVGNVVLDRGAETVKVGRTEVRLTAYEYRVLTCLMERVGLLVSKDHLHEYLLPGREARPSNSIEVLISRCRIKIAAAGGSPKLIETIRGRGYRIDPVDAQA